MPLPADYDNPDGQAVAEAVIRGAIADMFLVHAAAYLFDAGHVHDTPRFVDTEEEWEAIALVEDPDTSAQPTDGRRTLVRYFHVVYAGHRKRLRELTLNYEIDISMGFKDEYESAPGLRSYNELTALTMKFEKFLADNQGLGLDERVSHSFLQVPGKPIWTPVDSQGETTTTVRATLAVTLQVC